MIVLIAVPVLLLPSVRVGATGIQPLLILIMVIRVCACRMGMSGNQVHLAVLKEQVHVVLIALHGMRIAILHVLVVLMPAARARGMVRVVPGVACLVIGIVRVLLSALLLVLVRILYLFPLPVEPSEVCLPVVYEVYGSFV